MKVYVAMHIRSTYVAITMQAHTLYICSKYVLGFLIRSYGTRGIGRCSMAQCYDKTLAMLAQSKIKKPNVVN